MTKAVVEIVPQEKWLVGYADLRRLTGLSREAIRHLVARGDLPPPARVGKHHLWNSAVIRAALESLTAKGVSA